MKRVRIAAIFVVMGLVIGIGVLPGWSRQTPQELIKQGNTLWEQQSYTEAATAYQKAFAADPTLAKNQEIRLRLVIALIRAKDWDKAIVAADAFVADNKGTVWEARGQVWRGRLYSTVEHNGYRVGKRITRGYNTPPSEGKNTPQYMNFAVLDSREVYNSLLRAKTLYEKFRAARSVPEPFTAKQLLDEEIELNFDFAHILAQYNTLARYDVRAVDWTIDLKEPFDPLAPTPKQVMYLYEQIIALDSARDGNHHDTVLATVGKAAYILELRRLQQYTYPLIRTGSRTSGINWQYNYRRPIPAYVPYREIDPIRLLENVLAKYPNDSDADRLAYLIALWTEQKGDVLNALSRYYGFLRNYPKSRYVTDVKGRLQQINNPELNLSVQTMNRVGTRPVVQITARNLTQIHLTAYRVYLEDVWGKETKDAEGKTVWYSLDLNRFAGIGAVPHRKEKIAEWTATMNDTGKHEYTYANTPAPLDSLGAYLIEAVPVINTPLAAKEPVKATTMAIVSDFDIIQKIDKDASLIYAGDATTGSPLANVKISTLTLTHDTNYRDVEFRGGTTDMAGTARIVLPPRKNESPDTTYRQRITQAFAMAGANRYAVTHVDNFGSELPVGAARFRAYVYTDRPLYRPAQTVNFRVAVSDGIPGTYHTALDKTLVDVAINSPKGEVYRKKLTLDGFGSASDKLDLPAGVDLGDYGITVRDTQFDQGNPRAIGGGTFRVEEYKKPEFAVSVQPEKSQVRVGETMRVTIGAKFFFGAPVVGAKVHYKVFRTPLLYPQFFNPKVDWYDSPTNYDNGNFAFSYASYRSIEPQWDLSYFGNTAYREGDLTTNAKGEAIVTFPTDPPKPPKGWRLPPNFKPAQNFTVTADVVDDSRRQVTGVGAAKATATQFKAALRLDRRFLLADDSLKIEARTIDANGKPFLANGYVSFYKQIPAIPEQRVFDPKIGKEVVTVKYVPAREEKIETLFLPTDASKDGHGLLFWRPMMTGEFRIQYDAKDAFGNDIVAMASVLVYGTDFDTRLEKNDGRFNLTPEYADYHPGDTARVLIITPKPDSYVLFTEQAVGTVKRYRTVFVPGRSTVISVPIDKENLPNTEMTISLIRDGQIQETRAAVGVVAERQILTLAVTADKQEYKPGEKATFRIKATDADGKPVKGEFSLAVVDEALLALQADSTLDIRRFFYGYTLPASTTFSNSVYYNTGTIMKAFTQVYYETHDLWYPEGMSWIRDRMLQGRPQMPPYIENQVFQYPLTKDFFVGGRTDRSRFGFGGSGGFGGGQDGLYRNDNGAFSETASRRSGLREEFNSPMGAMGPLADEAVYDSDGAKPMSKADGQLGRLRDAKQLGMPSGSAPNYVEAVVRKLFADTAYWVPNIQTDADGYATVTFDFPDNITKWKVISRGLTADVKVGYGDTQTTVKKNLMARLQAPRFFVERDQVTISANVHNYLDAAKQTRIELVIDEHLAFVAGDKNAAVRTISLDKDGELRVDWVVDIKNPGKTKIKVVAQTDTESDAAELEFPVLVHGVEKFIVQSGVLRNGGTTTLTLDLPEMRRKGASLLNVQVSPSLASVMLDALPYLEDYPYGCVEQTISRFMPSVLVARTLRDSGIDLETLGKQLKALEEQRANIPPQQVYENSGYTYPKGKPGVLQASDLASRIGYSTQRGRAPVFNTATLNAMVNEGLARLAKMQKPTGGWGWWEGSPTEDYYLSAFVTEGLINAQRADIAVNSNMLTNAVNFLNARLAGTDDPHLRAYMTYVVTESAVAQNRGVTNEATESINFLYTRRDRLNAYGKAILCLALSNAKDKERATILLQNLITLAKIDRDRGTVHWEGDPTYYWHWYNDRIETTAMVLRALVAAGGSSQLEPVNGAQKDQTGLAPMAVRWLTDNRRGGMWTATRQTANAIQALNAYVVAQKELAPDYTVTLDLDGKVQKTFHLTKENALLFDTRFLVGDEVFTSGAQKLTITMQGTGTLYYNAYLKYFDMQEPIKGVANAIGVERKYYKIVSTQKKDKQGNTVTSSERQPLTDGAILTSGDIIEVELFLKSDNEYDYLVFEDMKPAGCEPTETRSGTSYGDGLCTNFELRDEKVAFFVDHLPQGTRRIVYKLRAEIPGAFHVLPTNGYAMYTPDIRALSDEMRLSVKDAVPAETIVKKKK